jgi:predicted ester cyclase
MVPEGDDRVITRISGRSRHTGEFQGVAPTGGWVKVMAVITSLISDGKIVQEWRNMSWSAD